MSAARITLRTAPLAAGFFLFFYPSSSDLAELARVWTAAAATLFAGAWITWKTRYPQAGALTGLRLAYRSWFRPDAPRVP